MNEWPALGRFLRTGPRDVGCAKAMELLHAYVELVAAHGRADRRAVLPGRRGAPAGLRAVRPGL
jgi:hypothetical protein